MVGNGGAELIDLVIQVFAPSQVGVLEPAFGEYASSATKRNISVQSVTGTWERGFIPNPDDVDQLIHTCQVVFIGFPNNPTGHLLPVSWLERWAQLAADQQTWLIIDEAFIDFVIDEDQYSFIQWLNQYPTTLVIRSMTKFFALPGLRLGYLVGNPNVLRSMKKQQVPWSVNMLAQEAGVIAMSKEVYEGHAAKVHQWLHEEKEKLWKKLNQFSMLEVFPSEVNYFLIRFKNHAYTSQWLQKQLGKKGILIRDCAIYQGLDSRYFRIAIKSPMQNQTLIQTLQEVLLQ
jgi:threonine-phosphate decarboxylase